MEHALCAPVTRYRFPICAAPLAYQPGLDHTRSLALISIPYSFFTMAQKSILTVLFALFVGLLFVFAQQADAAKGPIITNKVSSRE